MAVSEHPAYRAEKMHLDETLQVIFREKQVARKDRLDAEGALSNARMYDPDALPIREMLYARAVQNEKNLSAAEKRPYFTRIDFTETGKQSQTYYIGKYGVLKSDTLESQVIDWRAPVANLYYSGQIGPLKYTAPDGEVEGELTLKRQFGIEDSRLISIFDTDIVAQDKYLKDVLSQTTGDRLKEIITTIQAEQNYVIRYPLEKNLVVQGVAGSGKTTIALHRIAYLLYTYQKRLQPENMLILAPSPLFLNFISQVLPDLGVESVRQTTFPRFVQQILGPACPKTADSSGEIHQMLSLPGEELEARSRVMRYKGSTEFMRRLEKWLDDYEARFPLEEGLKFGPVVLYTPEELRKFLLEDEKPFPLRRRLEELKKQLKLRVKGAVHQLCDWYARECDRRILALPKTVAGKAERTARGEKLHQSMLERQAEVKKRGAAFPAQALKLFPETDPARLYRLFWQEMQETGILPEAAAATLEAKRFSREDLAPITLIAQRTLELKRPDIRHIVIDEAQDFNAFEVCLLQRLARSATFTIVGDLMQGIAGYRGIASWREFTQDVFQGKCQTHELVTSYRNTVEIMDTAARVMKNLPIPGLKAPKPVLRHGDAPTLCPGTARDAAALAKKWYGEGMASVAIVGRNSKALEALSREEGWPILNPEAESYPAGVVLAPADTVKGLEFDAVILLDGDAERYPARPLDARLLYVCLTRALHRLTIFYKNAPSPLLKA